MLSTILGGSFGVFRQSDGISMPASATIKGNKKYDMSGVMGYILYQTSYSLLDDYLLQA